MAFFVLFGFIFDRAILWQDTAGENLLGAATLLVSAALWAIAFAGWGPPPAR